MVDQRQVRSPKGISGHLLKYLEGFASVGGLCALILIRFEGWPWKWPPGIGLAWVVLTGLFGFTMGLALDNVPPDA